MTARNVLVDHLDREVPVSRSVQMAAVASVMVVFAAVAANILLARMTQSELNDLPFFFSFAYDWGGRPGVTLAVIGVGLGVILLGLIGERVAIGCGRMFYGSGSAPYSSDLCDFSHSSGSSMMQLESAKYLGGYRAPEPPRECERPPTAEEIDSEPEPGRWS